MAQETQKKKTSFFVYVFVIALFVRGGVLFFSLNSFDADPDAYRALAENIYSYGVFGEKEVATAFRPPLYPATLAALIPLQNSDDRSARVDSLRATSEMEKRRHTLIDKLALSRNASIALWHWILGVATVTFTYAGARKLGLSEPLASLAALLVAVDPILLQQSRLVMTETLAAFFAAALLFATILVVQRRPMKKSSCARYLMLGALYGLSTLCRPAFWVFAALALLNLILLELLDCRKKRAAINVLNGDSQSSEPTRRSGGLARIVAFLLGVACLSAPWCARNYRAFGKPILTTTHGGYTLLLANNPELYHHYATASSPLALWNPDEFFERNRRECDEAVKQANVSSPKERELFQDEWSRRYAIDTIKAQPEMFAYSCFIRIAELWRALPNDVERTTQPIARERDRGVLPIKFNSAELKDQARYAVAAFYLVEFFVAVVGCAKLYCARRRNPNKSPIASSPYLWGFLLVLSVQIPHLVYWTNMRMRAPIEVFLPVLASLALASMRNLDNTHKTKSSQNEQN